MRKVWDLPSLHRLNVEVSEDATPIGGVAIEIRNREGWVTTTYSDRDGRASIRLPRSDYDCTTASPHLLRQHRPIRIDRDVSVTFDVTKQDQTPKKQDRR